MDEKPPQLMTPAQRRFLEAAERIRTDRPTLEDLAYMARELVQVTLPHRNPGDVPAWSRANGNLAMTIRPGWDARAEKSIGYPYGSIPRLLLFWLTAEAVRTRCRTIELGSSLSDFMAQLGLSADTGRGPRGDATRLREQMQRLFRATISFDRKEMTEGGRDGSAWLDMQIAPRGEFWWSPRDPAQTALWGSWIELGEAFFAAITAQPIPLDMRALMALKRSPLALDLYAWLTYEAYRAHKSGKERFVAWSLLAKQMGSDYAEVTNFQQKAVAELRKVEALYPALKLGSLRGGVRIEPGSLPAITPRPSAAPINQPPIERRPAEGLPTPGLAAPPPAVPEGTFATADQFGILTREMPGEAGSSPERRPEGPPANLGGIRTALADAAPPAPPTSPATKALLRNLEFLFDAIEMVGEADLAAAPRKTVALLNNLRRIADEHRQTFRSWSTAEQPAPIIDKPQTGPRSG